MTPMFSAYVVVPDPPPEPASTVATPSPKKYTYFVPRVGAFVFFVGRAGFRLDVLRASFFAIDDVYSV